MLTVQELEAQEAAYYQRTGNTERLAAMTTRAELLKQIQDYDGWLSSVSNEVPRKVRDANNKRVKIPGWGTPDRSPQEGDYLRSLPNQRRSFVDAIAAVTAKEAWLRRWCPAHANLVTPSIVHEAIAFADYDRAVDEHADRRARVAPDEQVKKTYLAISKYESELSHDVRDVWWKNRSNVGPSPRRIRTRSRSPSGPAAPR